MGKQGIRLCATLIICSISQGAFASSFEPQIIGGSTVTDKTSPVYRHTVRLLAGGYIPKDGVPAALAGKRMGWRCSGAILSSRHVLTAAHCYPSSLVVTDPTTNAPIRVPLERISIEIFSGLNPSDGAPLGVKVNGVVRHPGFSDSWTEEFDELWNPTEPVHDIAVLRLARSVPSGKGPVGLVPQARRLATTDRFVLAGYGRTLSTNPYDVPTLRQVEVPYIKQLANRTDLAVGIGRFDSPAEIPEPAGACSGDSGGPAYLQDAGKTVLAGVIVRGPGATNGGCASGVSVLTDLRAYGKWIGEAIANLPVN